MGKKEKQKRPKEIEVREYNIILRIPEDAVSLTVEATTMDGEKPVKMKKKLSVRDIFEAKGTIDSLSNADGSPNTTVVNTMKDRIRDVIWPPEEKKKRESSNDSNSNA